MRVRDNRSKVEDRDSRRNSSNSSSVRGKVDFKGVRAKLGFSNGQVAGSSRDDRVRVDFSSVRASKVDDRSLAGSNAAIRVFSSVRKADNNSVREVQQRRRNRPGQSWEQTRRGSH